MRLSQKEIYGESERGEKEGRDGGKEGERERESVGER